MTDTSPDPAPAPAPAAAATTVPVLDRVRAVATLLPGVEERSGDGGVAFLVEDVPFVQVREDAAGGGATMVRVRSGAQDGSNAGDADAWDSIAPGADADWILIEDRIARSWELAAPRSLLEAGGR